MSVKDCPKCGKERVADISCPYCGVVYTKYAAPAPVENQTFVASRPTVVQSRGWLIATIVIVVAFFVIADPLELQLLEPEQKILENPEKRSNSDSKEMVAQLDDQALTLTKGLFRLSSSLPPENWDQEVRHSKNPNGDAVTLLFRHSKDAKAAVLIYNIWHVQHQSDLVSPNQLTEEIEFVLKEIDGSMQSKRHFRTEDKRLAVEIDFEGRIEEGAVVGRIRAIELSENEIAMISFFGKDERSLFAEEGNSFLAGLTIEQLSQPVQKTTEGPKKTVVTSKRRYYCGLATRLPSQRSQKVQANDIPKNVNQARGCLTVLEIYSSRCGICKKIAPEVAELRRKYASKGLAVIGYSVDPSEEDYKIYLKDLDYDLPYNALILDPEQDRQKTYDVIQEMGVDWPGALPLFVLLDADGSVLMRFTGASDFSKLEERVKQLL